MNFETPEADAVEQQQEFAEVEEEPVGEPAPTDNPDDVNPADLAEQRTVVPDDDGYDYD